MKSSSEPATRGDVDAGVVCIVLILVVIFAIQLFWLSNMEQQINSRCVPAQEQKK